MTVSDKKKCELDALVIKIAKKLTDEAYVRKILEANAVGYKGCSVAVSYPALCILFSELHLNFPQYEFDRQAHKYLELVNNDIGKNRVQDISLFDGLCGVGFAADCMSDNGRRYQSFIGTLNGHIADIAEQNIANYKKLPLNEFFYDVMYGLTGTANYLLRAGKEETIKNTLLHILQYLTELCKVDDNGIPQFAIQADKSQLFRLVKSSKIRYVNLGLSHGIPGILLVLLRAYEAGIAVPKQLEAIRYLAEYLFESCVITADDSFWEAQKIIGIGKDKAVPARDAWCYGTPGVAYSLLIAARVLKQEKMRELAVESMKQSLSKLRDVISPTFCHGLSGLCCLARKFYEYTKDEYFYEMYMKLLDQILELYSDENPFGFIDKELEKGKVVDKNEIGLLTGTSGVLLTILSCYRPVKTGWDSIFLL